MTRPASAARIAAARTPASPQLAAPKLADRRMTWAADLRRSGLSPLGRNFPGGAVVTYDHDLRFVIVGGGGLTEVGLSKEMLENRTPAEAFGSALADQVEAAYRLALTGTDAETEMRFNGRILSQRLTAVRDEDGAVLGGMGFVQDVTQSRTNYLELLESEERFRLAFDNAPIGKAVVELDGIFRQVNPALCRLFGYPANELLALRFQDITHPDDLDADLELLAEVISGERSTYQLEKRYLRPGGEYVWTLLSVGLVRSPDGAPLHFISQIQDMSDRKRHETELLSAHAFQQAVLAASPDFIHVLDVRQRVALWTSRSLQGSLGYRPNEVGLLGEGFAGNLIPAEDVERFQSALASTLQAADGEVVELRHLIKRADGERRWVSNRLTPFQRDDSGAVAKILGVSRDVTDIVAFEERLEHAALHDELTGLPNRRLINRRLGEALDRVGSTLTGPVADQPDTGKHVIQNIVVLFCDLDGFKRVNDAHGHQIGDALLRESSTRLVGATRVGDTVGRMGGDEFVVLLPVAQDEDPAAIGAEVADRIIRAVGQPVILGATEHTITASIGICVAQPGTSPEDLLRDADTAMYRAKLNGKDGHALFEPTLRENARTRDSLVRLIRQSLADNTLDVHYQPIVDPASGRVAEVEALLRIPGADGRFLDTAAVISVAEQTGLMGALGERILRRACEQTATWRRTPDGKDLRVAVNLSATEIARPGLYGRVTEIVRGTGMELRALTLEVTETVLLDAATSTLDDLRRLHADGVGIAIDDFGTGYAGLRYLATLPVTVIKVDRSFTAGLPHDAISSTIVRATIGLATELRLGCVVEGVETRAQLDALPRADGLLVQGYYFARPAPASVQFPWVIEPA